MSSPQYSIIIPVYNRPQEIEDLLQSLIVQEIIDFEVVIVEDGSTNRCDLVVDRFRDKLDIQYFFKPNSGPGPSRNFGFAQAKGKYLVVFDSDCIIPSGYFKAVEKSLHDNHWDAWGGPDRAHENFTSLQRAMGYTMSSILTTGGIRGGKKRVGWFQPRSFNMGMKRSVFEKTQGFKLSRYAEDIEFSIRMKHAGYKIGLITEAYVYHKRRTNLKQFYQQVFNFGRGRVMVGKVHPREVKLTHWFPTFFLAGTISIILTPLISLGLFALAVGLFVFYLIAILIHSYKENKDTVVALLSVPAALLQLWGYGAGFLSEKLGIIH
jgi:glycosyltransferase involved in cell wall biosynthesis